MGKMDSIIATGKDGDIFVYHLRDEDFVKDKTDRVIYNNVVFHSLFFDFIAITSKEELEEIKEFYT